MNTRYQILTPVKLGRKVTRNRIVMSPMECRLNTMDGSPTQQMIDYYEARARGGVGMIIVENTYIDDLASRSSLSSSGLCSDHQISGKALLADAITFHGALAVIQLSHGGRQANARATGRECVAPSPVPCKVTQRMPRELTVEEVEKIIGNFADAAVRAKKAGFDGVEIHGAHGYLLAEFLSPYTNKRKDAYGGSFENRARMPKEVIRRVREKVGRDFIVGYRISVDEYLGSEGIQPQDACRFAAEVQDDIDYINCSAGNYETSPFTITNSTYQPKGKLIPLAAEMKNHVSIPVIAVGSLDAQLGEQVLKNGDADLVAFGRQLIVDPEFANKIAEDRWDDIRPCCRGQEGCTSGFDDGYPIRCELNPSAGQERRFQLKKAKRPQKVVIIGGGCAGLEAARVADMMGHRVVLLEKSGCLGGHLNEAVIPPFKDKTRDALTWLIRQVKGGGTQIELNADTSPDKITALQPDIIIVAVGSTYTVPPVMGVAHAIYADEALMHIERVGQHVVVIGGGLVGAETAMTLAESGRNVVIVEMLDALAVGMDENARAALHARIRGDNIGVLTSHTVKEIRARSLVCSKGGEEKMLDADTIVIAAGLTANVKDAAQYDHLGIRTVRIGDCIRARNIYSAMHEAWKAALHIS